MIKNHNKLINYLLKKTNPITAKELSKYLNVSVRTVKNYIRFINEDAKETIIFSSVHGYDINSKKAKIYLENFSILVNSIPQSYEERANYINKKFLMNHITFLDVYDISEELFVSTQTIKLDIQKMNKSFENFNVCYEIHSEQIHLIADEESLRKLARFTLFEFNTETILDYSLLRELFIDVDIDEIEKILLDAVEKYDLYVNDFSKMNILLHLAIIIMRIKNNKILSNKQNFEMNQNGSEYAVVEYLSDKLGENFLINFTKDEKDNIFLLIKANTNVSLSNSQDDIENFIGESFIAFTRTLVRKLNTQYYVNLTNDSFIALLSLHFKNLLFRSQNEKEIIDPMNEVIRYSYPLIFDMAVYATMIFEETFYTKVDASEVTYIALHIGGEMERQEKNFDKIKTVLLCPKYLDFDIQMQKQIMVNFNQDIDLLACVGNLEELHNYNFELLISTIILEKKNYDFEVVEVPFLGIDNSKRTIEIVIDKIKEKKQAYILKDNFDKFFSESLFSVSKVKSMSKEKAMEITAQKLKSSGVVEKDFLEKITERDAVSSTGFLNIAIPHSVDMDAIKTSICVLIVPNGIQWGGQNVKIVLTIAIHKADRSIFRELYQSLIQLCSVDKNIRFLITSKSFDDFKQSVFSLL